MRLINTKPPANIDRGALHYFFTTLSFDLVMSTQDAPGIAFSASHQKQAFRLLELPPELLQLLESDNPPT
jgi:hypothetical protein